MWFWLFQLSGNVKVYVLVYGIFQMYLLTTGFILSLHITVFSNMCLGYCLSTNISFIFVINLILKLYVHSLRSWGESETFCLICTIMFRIICFSRLADLYGYEKSILDTFKLTFRPQNALFDGFYAQKFYNQKVKQLLKIIA